MDEATWRRVVAAAASVEERRELPGLRAIDDPNRREQRLKVWCEMAGVRPRHSFQELVAARALEATAALDGLREVEVTACEALPPWARTLREALVGLGEPPYSLEGASPPIAALWPWTHLGARRLDAAVPAGLLEPSARWDLLRQLGRRLLQVAIQVFDQELHTHQAAAALSGEGWSQEAPPPTASLGSDGEAWGERLDRYPVLGRLLAVVVDHWSEMAQEFVGRLAEDAEAIESELGVRILPVRRVEADAGDLHEGGRSVLILESASGRVVYKPKQLEIARCWQDLATLLDLPQRPILVRSGRTWEAFIEHQECSDIAGVRRFYRRMGQTLRLLQLLAARDFWLDNLVAHGDEPHFVDLEMALQPPQFAGGDDLLAVERGLMASIEETVLPIGVVAYRSPVGDGVEAVDLGALSPQRSLASPYRLKLVEGRQLGVEPELTDSGHVSWSKEGFVPILDGEAVRPSDYIDEVVAGYRDLHHRLTIHRQGVARCLASLEGCELRIIVRDTWTCQRLVQESVQTRLLTDGVTRDLYFERLMRGARGGEGWDASEVAIVDSEIAQLRGLDIPAFRIAASGRDLLSARGLVVADHFLLSPLATARRRLDGLDDFDLDSHVATLRSCFATGSHPPKALPARQGRERGTAAASGRREFDPLELAGSIADRVLAAGRRGERGELAWLGVVDQPQMRCKVLEVIRPTTPGSAGWARLLAHLAKASGEARWGQAALDTLASARHSARMAIERWPAVPPDPTRTPCGVIYGVGAQLVALDEVGRVLEDPELQRLAQRYADALPPFEQLVAQCTDSWAISSAGGAVGLLWALSAISHPRAPQLARALLAALWPGEAVGWKTGGRAPLTLPPGLNGTGTVPAASNGASALALGGLPDTAGGLARALEISEDEELAELGRALCAILPSPRGVGEQLTRRALPRSLAPAFERASSTELLDAIELDLAHARRSTGEPRLARSCIEEFVQRKAVTGSWFPDRHGDDLHDLSTIDGLGAVAWGALRLAQPCSSPRLPDLSRQR